MKKSLRLILLWGIMGAVTIAGKARSGPQEAQVVCGSYDGVGNSNILDLINMVRYLFNGAPPPADPTLADTDGRLMLTLGDVETWIDFTFWGGAVPICPPSDSNPAPLDSTLIVHVAGFATAGSTATELAVFMTNPSYPVTGFTLPIKIELDGNPVHIQSSSLSPITTAWDIRGDTLGRLRVDTANGIALLSAAWITSASPHEYIPMGTHEIGRIVITYPSADTVRDFSYSWKAMSPIQPMSGGYPDTSLIPLVMGPYADYSQNKTPHALITPYSPLLTSSRSKPGDVNGNGVITVADLVHLVSFLFNSGPSPVPFSAGNVNCSGSISIADLVYLVSYLFNNGPVPCA